jgi:heme-degrading monooxygenase HmoA
VTTPGFLAIYRWTVEPGQEAAFEDWWRNGTDELKAHGSFGSTLGREADGRYLGIALWPNAESRTAAFAARSGSAAAPGLIAFDDLASGAIVDLRWSSDLFQTH